MSSDPKFENAVFRYRSIDALLGEHEELERQTVYFAPPEYLNDPMEGLRQIYWRGDRITWRNLLKHYVICLQNRLSQALLTDDAKRLDPQTISVFETLDSLPSKARSLCQACIAAVEAGELHPVLLDLLASADRDISFSELQQLLRTVHIDWLTTVHKIFAEHGLAQQVLPMNAEPSGLVDVLRTFQSVMPQVHEQVSDDGVEIINDIQQIMAEQMDLLTAWQNADVLRPQRESLLFEFTSEYLTNLGKLMYPPWHVACFSGRHDNAAMWSYYAGNHRGCCLVFRTDETKTGRRFRLKGPNGYGSGGISRSVQNLPLEPVCYTADEQRIEFFANIGQLSFDTLMRNWFQDQDGHTSPLAEHLHEERQEVWRNAYWEKFSPPLLKKLPDWQHEDELRIVLSDILDIHGTDEGRTFTYDYDTLDGIIFGINTNLSDKVRIMRIVDAKLANRSVPDSFKFYQAGYNAKTGLMEARHLNLIAHVSNRQQS